MRVRYYGLGSSAPRTSTRHPYEFSRERRVATRRYTLGVLSAVASYDSGTLPQVAGEIRFRCACCGNCPPDHCAEICSNCYCDTTEYKYYVRISEPPTKEGPTDCEECQNFGDGGDGCCGDLCFMLTQSAIDPCLWESKDINFCGKVYRFSYQLDTNATVDFTDQADTSKYVRWCNSGADYTCVDYTVPVNCQDSHANPWKNTWHVEEDTGVPCNWLVGARSGQRVSLAIVPYSEVPTQCSPQTCECEACCDSPVLQLWVTVEGFDTAPGGDQKGDPYWPCSSDIRTQPCYPEDPADADDVDCTKVQGVYHLFLQRPDPDGNPSGPSDCCYWNTPTIYDNPYPAGCTYDGVGNITYRLSICKDQRVCSYNDVLEAVAGTGCGPGGSYYKTFINFGSEEDTFSDTTSYCFGESWIQADGADDPHVGVGSPGYCDDTLDSEFYINSPLCRFDGVVLPIQKGRLRDVDAATLTMTNEQFMCKQMSDAGSNGPYCEFTTSLNNCFCDYCYGFTEQTATITATDPGA